MLTIEEKLVMVENDIKRTELQLESLKKQKEYYEQLIALNKRSENAD